MASKNVTIIKEFLTEFGTGPIDKAFSYLLDDSKWEIAQVVRRTVMTKSELRERIGGMRAAFKDGGMVLTPVHIIENGDDVFVELESHGTTILDKTYENRYSVIFKMSNGKIADVREYNDPLHVLEVLLPAVAAAKAKAG